MVVFPCITITCAYNVAMRGSRGGGPRGPWPPPPPHKILLPQIVRRGPRGPCPPPPGGPRGPCPPLQNPGSAYGCCVLWASTHVKCGSRWRKIYRRCEGRSILHTWCVIWTILAKYVHILNFVKEFLCLRKLLFSFFHNSQFSLGGPYYTTFPYFVCISNSCHHIGDTNP